MSRCPRSLLLVLSLLVVACGDDPEGSGPSLTAPTVREVTPSGGPISGNTLINVYGSGFQAGAKLYLGNQEALRTVVVNSFRIYGYTPTGTTAAVDVRVLNPDGAYGVLVNGFIYEGPPAPNIDQAEVLNGNQDAVSGGQPVGVVVRGAITVAGLTRGVGQGGGVRAQAGFAPADADLLKVESYTWEEATYEKDSDSGEADIYKGNVLLQPAIGGESREWVIAMRFSIDGGKTWVLADGDGIANGVSNAMLRRVFISRPRVDYCKLGPDGNRANPELFYKPGDTTLLKVLGQVYAAGITQGAGAGSGLTAQLGIGPVDTDPRTSEAWTWINATYKAEHGNNDEWEAELPNPGVEGTYKIAFRFSISENAWRMCDADGVNDSTEGELTFSLAKLGTLTVGNEAPKPPVGWCKIGEDQKAPEAINYQTTQTTGLKTVYAQVYMAGVTDKVGAGPGLSGQLGWGPAGEDPRTSPLWNWSTALAFNKDNFQVNDEWKATLPNPGLNGEYRYAVRFSGNGGPVRVCDGNGVDDGGQDFELDQLGQLSVTGEVVVPKVVGYCKLGPDGNTTPESVTYATGAEATRKVVGQVFVQGVTSGAGAGAGVVGQLGYGPAGQDPATSAQWTWTTAAYKDEVGNNDQFEATLPNPGTAGSYRFAYRFKVNDGAYLLCDADGNAGGATGFETAKMGTLTVSAAQDITIGWCKLGGESNDPPPNEVYRVGQATKDIYAQVYMEGVTPGTGAGAGIQGQVGYGPVADAPDSANWHWTSTGASFNRESGGGNNDEWKAALPNPGTPGQYKFAIRFNVNGGAYRYCDADGLDNGFSLAQAGNLEVKAVGVDACQLVGPASLNATPGGTTAVVRGKVLVTTVTDVTSGAGAGITSEVGYGPEGSDPATTSGWSWKAASFAAETDSGAQDAYETALTAPAAEGTYAVAVRFRYQTGAWAYCDRDGSANGYQPAQASVLTVAEVVPPQVDWCRLGGETESAAPSETYSVGEAASKVIAVQVHEAGVTPGSGAGAGITAELGYGPSGSAHTGGAWQWVAATYAADTGNTQNDEYRATLPNPGTAGGYKFAYRVKLGTGPYVYCDANGTDDGFDVAQAGTLTVQDGAAAFCRLQAVSGTTVGSGDAVTVTGRVRIPGVTNGNGAGAGLQVQVGLGNADVNASTTPASFSWKPATYSREAPDEVDTDEFGVELRPAYTTSRAVSMRYSTDSGATWTYCDKDGSDVGGYSQGQQHALTVGNHSGIDYCRLQWPLKLSDLGGGRTIYGFIYEDGVTNAPPPATNLSAELGHGPKDQDPGVSPAWTWVAGTVNNDQNNDDEYKADLPANAALNHGYLWRFRVGTGPYCYGDWQPDGAPGGSSNGVAPENLGTVDVAP
ncbi:IPT/TIG domain-containing protein [Myxococcus sp. K15C18031901]|uniref:IPT/TIG domain-containing protein n=1 Tax=Myxococcus dinghuensis TaxID=2906761 RepID=UPI0020A7E29C|nr:IPT/TIG domain-containing protein [Myxococcus dinghuensis]MCP3098775.1 IPT/TIG domain-containing protein [Myxococcus dinghuensis]